MGSPIVYRLAARFRLEKTDPVAARSPVKKPIVFYVDRAAPEPVRDALMEGARWWAQAFDAAGFVDAFRVEVLPDGVSPLDARYNVINWVHRQTRGWSYGDPITDPRTGEIVKGSVLLGSLRARQDRMIFEGLVGADRTGTGGADDPVVISLAHIMEVRKIALARFGPANVRAGAALSDLRRVIVPIYLFHRYEVDAVAKSIGGVDFNYAVRGDGLASPRSVDGAAQRRALAALLGTLEPAVLDLPDSLIDQLSTGRDGSPDKSYEIELFNDSHTPVFDIASGARAAADRKSGVAPPPGMPIGGDGAEDCWFCETLGSSTNCPPRAPIMGGLP